MSATRVLPGRKAMLGQSPLKNARLLLCVRWTTCAAILFTAILVAAQASPRKGRPRMSDLPAAAKAQISAALGQDERTYYFVEQGGRFAVKNARHALSAEFTLEGANFGSVGHRWGMALRGYGFGEQLVPSVATTLRATDNHLEYERGGLTEWYVNGPLGLEQGFVVKTSPGKAYGRPLTLDFALSGDLSATLDNDRRGLTLMRDGVTVLRYSGLMARDANGHELGAWLEFSGNELRLRVDDTGAAYPVTIDPMFQATKLNNNRSVCNPTCIVGKADDEFGYSTSISNDGNTVAVAAPNASGSASNSGAIYVFLKNFRSGWGSCFIVGCHDYAAKLSCANCSAGLGQSVAISGDGTTIAALLDTEPPTSDPSAGLAVVFVKPSTGWASTSQQTAFLSLTGTENPPCPPYCSTWFPSSVSLNADGSTVILGYSGARVGTEAHGAVYVFVKPAGGWVDNFSPVKLTASPGADLELMGQSVAISSDGTTIAATAPQSGGSAGAVYVFVKPSGGWISTFQNAKLTYASGDGLSFLGNSVGITSGGETVVAGGNGRGLIFLRNGAVWINTNESAQLLGSDDPIGKFTISSDGTVVAGGGLQNSPGAVYLFVKPVTGWATTTESQKVSASDGTAGDNFGLSPYPGSTAIGLSNNGTTMIVGAPNATLNSNANQGAAYVFLGSAGTASASVSPSSLGFGTWTVGTTSTSQPATITNNGNGYLHISGVTASTNFSSANNCLGAAIPPGGSCNESASFAPTQTGTLTGTLTFTDDSGGTAGTSQQVQLSGTATKASTSTAITSVVPSPAFVGQAVTVSFTVSPQAGVSLIPSGVVTVKASTGQSCTASAPSGSCMLTFTTAGTRTLTAKYPGDSNFTGSTSISFGEAVKKYPTTTAVATSGSPSTIGQAVTFTATISTPSGGGPVPDGETVTFKRSGTTTPLGTAITSGGHATFTTSTTPGSAYLPAGTFTISATYSGDVTFAASTGSVKQVVNKFSSATAVTSSLNPSHVGDPVTFTATVTPSTGSIPNGETVTFKKGTTILGTGTTTGGQASFATSVLPAGTNTITAVYAGDANYATSSGIVKQLVNKFATTTTVGSSQNPSTSGQSVTFTATVSSTHGPIPDGDSVKFTYGATVLGTVTTSGGIASVSYSALPVGSDTVTATFAGDATYSTSKGTVVQKVQ